jgi:hypothetical protein
VMILPPAVPLQHLLHRYDGLAPRFEERPPHQKLLTIISVAGILAPGATVGSVTILVPVTVATAAAIAPLISGVGPVIVSVAVGRCEPCPIVMPVPLLVRSTVLIRLLFQTSSVVGVQDVI